jgi:hypothetical protein
MSPAPSDSTTGREAAASGTVREHLGWRVNPQEN